MKTRILILFVISLFYFIGCNTEESNILPANTNTSQVEKSMTFMRLDLSNNGEPVKVEGLKKTSDSQISSRTSENMSANGHFSPIEGWYCTFSGMENNSGIHGSAIITGPPAGFHMSAACLAFEGNEAVYGGMITEVFYQDDFFVFLEPGMYCAFKVKDNGEGQNAPADQVGTYIWIWTGDEPCQYLPPSSEEDWGPLLDVYGQGDQIQVK